MTKKDQPATKEDITKLDAKVDATAQSLSAKIDRVAMEVVRTQADVRDVKATMSTKNDVECIMRAIDGFTAQAVHYQRADATRGKALIDVEVSVADHERRITGLESARPRSQTP
jgi:hypothetical protein